MDQLEDFIKKIKEGTGSFGISHSQEKCGIEGYLRLIVTLRDRARKHGRTLIFEGVESVNSVDESDYRLFEDTGFENREVVPADEPYNYKRVDVYKAIEKQVAPQRQVEVKDKFDKRFPESIWGSNIPETAVLQILLKEHINDLI